MKSLVRKYVEMVPYLSGMYRAAREQYRIEKLAAQETPMGFLFGGNEQMVSGDFEPEEISFIRGELPNFEVFVDVGANLGLFTCLASKEGKEVVAIEPLTENVNGLLFNINVNGYKKVEVFPVCVSDEIGQTTIFGGGTGASLLAGWAGTSTKYKRQVPVLTLDRILHGRFKEKRILVKIDVEGAELSVLKGAVDTIQRNPKPIWMLEICLSEHHPSGKHPDYLEVFNIFMDRGYCVKEIGGNEYLNKDDILKMFKGERKTKTHNYIFRQSNCS